MSNDFKPCQIDQRGILVHEVPGPHQTMSNQVSGQNWVQIVQGVQMVEVV